MPKKFQGENSKATVARARKAEAQQAKVDAKVKAEEDAKWEDAETSRKFQKKEEEARRKQELLEKKRELKALHDAEMEQIAASNKLKSVPPPKITQHQLQLQKQRTQSTSNDAVDPKLVVAADDEPLVENLNRVQLEGEHASTVDEAIKVLSNADSSGAEVDKHPEKRMKAAYLAYEERRLPQLKQEHPTFRLSQLKQILKKEWQKSPENPLNQRLAAISS